MIQEQLLIGIFFSTTYSKKKFKYIDLYIPQKISDFQCIYDLDIGTFI